MLDKHMGMTELDKRWPVKPEAGSLSDAEGSLDDPTEAWTAIYDDTELYPTLFALAEALSEYEVYFGVWRFKHIKLVDRTIGSHVPGTGGSAGSGYLQKTLQYRFFPELWEARNRVTLLHPGNG